MPINLYSCEYPSQFVKEIWTPLMKGYTKNVTNRIITGKYKIFSADVEFFNRYNEYLCLGLIATAACSCKVQAPPSEKTSNSNFSNENGGIKGTIDDPFYAVASFNCS